jgi:hypothetical protein
VVRQLVALALFSGVAGLVGCGPAWTVVRDTPPPSPLKGAGPISVSFDYSKLMIGGKNEQEWVQSKMAADPAYEKSWTDLKASFETNFLSGLGEAWAPGAQPGPPGPGVHLFVVPQSMTMGKYVVVAATATTVNTRLAFVVDGKDAGEIAITGAQSATIMTPSVHQHMPGVASYIGRTTGRFVASKK